jgi:hypothetical protein
MNGVFRSTDNGTSWTAVDSGLTNNVVTSFAVYGSELFAGTFSGGIFLSTNNGTSWSNVDSGFTNTPVQSFAISGSYLFAGTVGSGVWKRPLTEMVTGIEEKKNNLPVSFSLYQNYPNPFNPTTTIKYGIPKSGYVTIRVYDELGREVATLVNEEKPGGNYSVSFNGANFTSGVYYYRLQVGSFAQTKKLILLK